MKDSKLTMNKLPLGSKAKIASINATGSFKRRMQDLGFSCGTIVEAVHRSPSGNPVAYSVKGSVIALRNEDAKKIELTAIS